MQPYVVPDSITDIANWFKAAKPEPTNADICTQIGCHFEEFAENLEAINGNADDIHDDANDLKSAGKTLPQADIDQFVSLIKPLELLDALCDQIVTATGVAYMMGFDIEGALKEVVRSNNSKMVKGKFEFDDNGKIAKPDSYSEPDLTPFISTMQNLHNASEVTK
jgi:predicted HAD superfamily Cof-like phosphohydrolase